MRGREPTDAQTDAFIGCIADLLENEGVRSMRSFKAHGATDCLEHCLLVAFSAYLRCLKKGLDARQAARGALLHDLYLYDWHVRAGRPYRGGFHGFRHAAVALKNAQARFMLGELESEVILRHMWPVTPVYPRYRESRVVAWADKVSAFDETFRRRRVRTRLAVLLQKPAVAAAMAERPLEEERQRKERK